MYGLDTIKYLNEQREKERERLGREPIKLRPDIESIRNPIQLDDAWECEIETECYTNDGSWLNSLCHHLREGTHERRAWLEEAALKTALKPLVTLTDLDEERTRLDIRFIRGDQHKPDSMKTWATWKARLTPKAPAKNKNPATKRIVIDYSTGILQPRIHDLHARMLVKQLTEGCGREILTSGMVTTCTVPMGVWLLFTTEERASIIDALGLEHATLTDLVATFFCDPEINANAYRDRNKEPHTYEGDSHEYDKGMDLTMYHVEWPDGDKSPKISKCAASQGSLSGLQGGPNFLLREKTR